MTTKSEQCPATRRAFLYGVDRGQGRSFLFVPGCKSWYCPVCGQRARKLWTARIYHGVHVYMEDGQKSWAFITLTSSRKLKRFSPTWGVWSKAWAKWSSRFRREYPGVRYALVPEQHKDGRVHSHMVASGEISQRWCKDNGAESGLGYMAKVRQVDAPGLAAWYCAKYLAKTLDCEKWPKGTRRVRTSQHWPELPKTGGAASETLEWYVLARNASISRLAGFVKLKQSTSDLPLEIIVG